MEMSITPLESYALVDVALLRKDTGQYEVIKSRWERLPVGEMIDSLESLPGRKIPAGISVGIYVWDPRPN